MVLHYILNPCLINLQLPLALFFFFKKMQLKKREWIYVWRCVVYSSYGGGVCITQRLFAMVKLGVRIAGIWR